MYSWSPEKPVGPTWEAPVAMKTHRNWCLSSAQTLSGWPQNDPPCCGGSVAGGGLGLPRDVSDAFRLNRGTCSPRKMAVKACLEWHGAVCRGAKSSRKIRRRHIPHSGALRHSRAISQAFNITYKSVTNGTTSRWTAVQGGLARLPVPDLTATKTEAGGRKKDDRAGRRYRSTPKARGDGGHAIVRDRHRTADTLAETGEDRRRQRVNLRSAVAPTRREEAACVPVAKLREPTKRAW